MCLVVFTHIYLTSNMKSAKVVIYSITSLVVLYMILNICFIFHYSKSSGPRKCSCWG